MISTKIIYPFLQVSSEELTTATQVINKTVEVLCDGDGWGWMSESAYMQMGILVEQLGKLHREFAALTARLECSEERMRFHGNMVPTMEE